MSNKYKDLNFNIEYYRDLWYKKSFQLDSIQSGKIKAKERFDNYKKQPLKYIFPKSFKGLNKPKSKNKSRCN